MKKTEVNTVKNPSVNIASMNANFGPDSTQPQYPRPEYARDPHPTISKKQGRKRQYGMKPARSYSQSVTACGDYSLSQDQGNLGRQTQHQPQPQRRSSADGKKSYNR